MPHLPHSFKRLSTSLHKLVLGQTEAMCSVLACSFALPLPRGGAAGVADQSPTSTDIHWSAQQRRGTQTPLVRPLPFEVQQAAQSRSLQGNGPTSITRQFLPVLRKAGTAAIAAAQLASFAQRATCSSKSKTTNPSPPVTDPNIAREDWGPGTAQLAKSLERLLLEAYTLLQQDKADIAEQLVIDGASCLLQG